MFSQMHNYSTLFMSMPNIRNLFAMSLDINEIKSVYSTITIRIYIVGEIKRNLLSDIYFVINHCRLCFRLVI